MKYTIPVVVYTRPHGRRDEGPLNIDCKDEAEVERVRQKLHEMAEHHIEVTIEQMGPMVNVCLDNGDFDYKFELFPNNENFPNAVKELVLAFDVNDYAKACEHNALIEGGE